jgi:hypothetical protein
MAPTLWPKLRELQAVSLTVAPRLDDPLQAGSISAVMCIQVSQPPSLEKGALHTVEVIAGAAMASRSSSRFERGNQHTCGQDLSSATSPSTGRQVTRPWQDAGELRAGDDKVGARGSWQGGVVSRRRGPGLKRPLFPHPPLPAEVDQPRWPR